MRPALILPFLFALAIGWLPPGDAHAGESIWWLAQSLRQRTSAGPSRAASLEPAAFRALAYPSASSAPVGPVGPAAIGASAMASGAGLPPGAQCRAAIAAAERAYHLPPRLLTAIGLVESGRRGPDGRFDPWPWSIDVAGVDHVYATKAEAVAAVRSFQAAGAQSIDVGCLQVNLMYHPAAFASLEDAFDPMRNADYGARFLLRLREQTGGWATATAWYHSASPDLGPAYARRVMAMLSGAEQGTAAGSGAPGPLPAAFDAPASAPPGTGAYMLGNRPGAARMLMAPAGTAGRGLAAYRASPVLIASRVALR
jgi:hypothetical protein